MGTVQAIYLRPAKDEPMVQVPVAKATIGTGLDNDYFKKTGGKRQVTLLSQEAWEQACQDLKQNLDPQLRRANLLVEGIDLKESAGKILKIGNVIIQLEGETAPCRLMDEAHPGLKNALLSDWRGGAYGKVLGGGLIKEGDTISWNQPL